MSRTARLLELLIRVQTRPHFTAQELADEFDVSRRTMLRDLNALAEMGVPLHGTPGPGGGYRLQRGGRRLSLSLTVDEALGVIVSYEAFLRYAVSPFSDQNLAVVTKLRAALPPDVVRELDEHRRHVAVLDAVRAYEAPLLGELFQAAVEGSHLKVVYDSASGISERVIYPFGVFAHLGFWYCACHDYKRGKVVSLRADRFRSIEPAVGFEQRPHIPVEDWVKDRDESDGEARRLRVHVNERGMKSFELATLFGRITPDRNGCGVIETNIPLSSIAYFAARFLSLGLDVTVESPPELVAAVRDHAQAIATRYAQQVNMSTNVDLPS